MAAKEEVGRFAPSPTGDLHFGSLLAALASYCEARSKHGAWQLRIDDIDGPRSVPGAASAIQESLKLYGFRWNEPVRLQSLHGARYKSALTELIQQQRVFVCSCSRRQLPSGGVYPGNCRNNILQSIDDPVHDSALRLRLEGTESINDGIQGKVDFNLNQECGDIVIWRRDQLVSYPLACAVDDATDVSEVIRGSDLLGNTGAQVAIMRYLKLTPPAYAHIPVAVDTNQDKLSKHAKSPAISSLPAVDTLMQAWSFLGQQDMPAQSLDAFWENAFELWDIGRVPTQSRLQV